MKTKTYDTKCWDLAEAFLVDSPLAMQTKENTHELASTIQAAIEDFLSDLENPPEREGTL